MPVFSASPSHVRFGKSASGETSLSRRFGSDPASLSSKFCEGRYVRYVIVLEVYPCQVV